MNQSIQPNECVTKLKTGIHGFDDISAGGLPEGRTTLMAGSAGTAKTLFAIRFLVRGIEDFDENGVFVTFEETPADITKNVRSLGCDLDKYVADGKLAFVDVSPDPDADNVQTGVYDFSALLVRIENAVNKVGGKRMGIDSVSALFTQFEDAALVRRELFRMAARLKQMKVTSLITAERHDEYGEISRYGVEEFVADNVIILRNTLEQEKRRRTIEILKYRGTTHQKGEYPFTITSRGIEVMSLSSMELTQSSSIERVSSGNTELDKMCRGGFYRDSIVLVSGPTGCGKTLLTSTFLDGGCRRGEKTLLFAFEESHDQLTRNVMGWGMDYEKWEKEGLLKIICRYPETMGLEDHLIGMKEEIEAFDPTQVAVDSVSALQHVALAKGFREFLLGLTSYLKSKNITGLLTSTSTSLLGGSSITSSHISTDTDTIILLRYVELLGEIRRGLTVLKMRGSDHEKAIREFEINNQGLNIGKAFRQVGGILVGAPTPFALNEEERMGGMLDDAESKLETAALI